MRLLKKLTPSVSPEHICEMQRETSEAKELISRKGTVSFGGIKDITMLLSRVQKGAALNMGELLQIAAVLHTARRVKEYFEDKKDKAEQRLLDTYAQRLSPNNYLEETIRGSILAEDLMADKASGELYEIRRKKRAASNRVRESLQKYVSGGEQSKYLQENIITMRNGRYVVPVKSEYRSEVKGLIHDSSSSGATVFIEPMSAVEANNEMLLLESREQAEIAKILAVLSMECARFSQNLSDNYATLIQLCAIFAKAEFSFRIEGVEPQISRTRRLELIGARHPLLDKTTVVPIDVIIGTDYTTLVITGPNTGGKTVTLKTIGLFAMMAQSGLHVPAKEGSSLPVFENILADIGDEQSIEQSLSTFSAHMVNIVDILSRFNQNSLVLFDELGAGTDPIEGAALAETILEQVRSVGALCAATTHYAELKAYALDTKGVSNASCEFDIETLKPTYKLSIGLPGRSNAFAIAKRLGMSHAIVGEAERLIKGESRRFESLIDKLEESRSGLETERENARNLRIELEQLRNQTRQQRERFNKKIEQEAERAEKQAKKLVDSARASADYIFAELEKIKKQKDKEDFTRSLEEAKQNVKDSLKKVSAKLSPVVEKINEEYTPPREFRVGDSVLLADIGRRGDIIQIDGEKVVVQTGIIKTKTKKANLRLEDRHEATKTSAAKSPKIAQNVSAQIDLRGMIAEDAWFMVDKYLDDAVLSSLTQVTLIHGKGTGALRNAIWKQLKHDSRVIEYRQGAYGEGDAGVTVVNLR